MLIVVHFVVELRDDDDANDDVDAHHQFSSPPLIAILVRCFAHPLPVLRYNPHWRLNITNVLGALLMECWWYMGG